MYTYIYVCIYIHTYMYIYIYMLCLESVCVGAPISYYSNFVLFVLFEFRTIFTIWAHPFTIWAHQFRDVKSSRHLAGLFSS